MVGWRYGVCALGFSVCFEFVCVVSVLNVFWWLRFTAGFVNAAWVGCLLLTVFRCCVGVVVLDLNCG